MALNNEQATKLIGVDMAVKAVEDAAYQPRAMIFEEFSLAGRIAVVSLSCSVMAFYIAKK